MTAILTMPAPPGSIPSVAYQYFRSEGQLGRIASDGHTEILQPSGTWFPFWIGQSDMTYVTEQQAETMAAGADLNAPANAPHPGL